MCFCRDRVRLRAALQNVFQSCKHWTLKAAFLSNLTQNFKLEFIDSFAPIIISTTSAETNNVMARGRSSFAEIQCKQKIVVYVLNAARKTIARRFLKAYKAPRKRFQHLLQHPFDFIKQQC